jgi:hypothetical protein
MIAPIKISLVLSSLLIQPSPKTSIHIPATTSNLITNSNIVDINSTIEKVFINENKE